MEISDALVPFLPAGMHAPQDQIDAPMLTRVAFLTKRLSLKATMRWTLPASRYALAQVSSPDLIKKAMNRRICDVAIVDIERKDEWPGAVFSRFDQAAANFPVIILCKERHQILNYLWKAQHVTDIVAYETISDPRFHNLIEAAVLRAELVKDIGVGDDWDWTPPTAA